MHTFVIRARYKFYACVYVCVCNVQIRISVIFYEFENAVFKTAEISAILIANKYNFHRNELFARRLGKGPVGERWC